MAAVTELCGLDPSVSNFAVMTDAGKHQHTSTRLHGVTYQPLFQHFLSVRQSFQTKTITEGGGGGGRGKETIPTRSLCLLHLHHLDS